MGVIRLHTENEKLIFDEKPIITSGNININGIDVTFCDKWLSLGETVDFWAVFFKDENKIHKRKLENGYCLIPNEVLTQKGLFRFGFYAEAENGEKVKTSRIAEYHIKQGVPTEDTGESEIVSLEPFIETMLDFFDDYNTTTEETNERGNENVAE